MTSSASLGSQLVGVLQPWRARLVAVAAAILGASLLELVPPLIVRHIIDDNLTVGRADGLVGAAALYLAAVAGTQLLTFTYSYQAAVVAQNVLHDLRVRLFDHLCRLPVAHHDTAPLGDTVNRCTADLDAVGLLFTEGVATLVGQLVPLVFVFAAMAVLSPPLTVVAALSLPPLVALTRVMRRKVRDAQRANRTALGRLASHLEEDLAGAEAIRAFAREDTFVERFRAVVVETLRAFCRSNLFNTLYAPLLGLLAGVFTALLLSLGARRFLGGTVPLGTLTAFVLLFQRFFTPITALGEQWQRVQGALAGAERVFDTLAVPLDEPVPPMSAEVGAGIELDGVTFGYAASRPVLRDVSLRVQPGEHVALVGRTGAGKTTLVHLIGGLYAPWTGEVRLAGLNPRALTDADRRSVLAVVPQQPQLLSTTVAENVSLGETASADAVMAALVAAGLGDVIARLPAGIDTPLAGLGGGWGAALSAGERQLLGLARALLFRPAVLVLDEATAYVDEATDASVRWTARRLVAQGTALLTVVHRLATAREADRIIVMEAGRIVEEGAPDALIAARGRFAHYIQLEALGWPWESRAAEVRKPPSPSACSPS